MDSQMRQNRGKRTSQALEVWPGPQKIAALVPLALCPGVSHPDPLRVEMLVICETSSRIRALNTQFLKGWLFGRLQRCGLPGGSLSLGGFNLLMPFCVCSVCFLFVVGDAGSYLLQLRPLRCLMPGDSLPHLTSPALMSSTLIPLEWQVQNKLFLDKLPWSWCFITGKER